MIIYTPQLNNMVHSPQHPPSTVAVNFPSLTYTYSTIPTEIDWLLALHRTIIMVLSESKRPTNQFNFPFLSLTAQYLWTHNQSTKHML